MLITSREDPPLPLARYRARSQLTEVRAAELRFTPAEATAFFNQMMGLTLSVDEIIALETRTEGWITGLQLAGNGWIARNGRQSRDRACLCFSVAGGLCRSNTP